MIVKVVVDFDLCESNALCMAAAPEVFEVRDDNFLYVLQEEPGEELRSKVEEALSGQGDAPGIPPGDLDRAAHGPERYRPGLGTGRRP